MKKYKVTLPIDLGDGVIHLPGEVLDMGPEQALAYAHALLPVEED